MQLNQVLQEPLFLCRLMHGDDIGVFHEQKLLDYEALCSVSFALGCF